MLNLIRLREIADYSISPALASVSTVSGAEALDRYVEHTLPYLQESGDELLLFARGRARKAKRAERLRGKTPRYS